MKQVTTKRTYIENHEGLNQYDVLQHRVDKEKIQFLFFIPEDHTFTFVNLKDGKMRVFQKHPFNVGYSISKPAINWNAPLFPVPQQPQYRVT